MNELGEKKIVMKEKIPSVLNSNEYRNKDWENIGRGTFALIILE